jgi:hypothetical protein
LECKWGFRNNNVKYLDKALIIYEKINENNKYFHKISTILYFKYELTKINKTNWNDYLNILHNDLDLKKKNLRRKSCRVF